MACIIHRSRPLSFQTADTELVFSAALGLIKGAVRLRVELFISCAGAVYPADAEAATGLQRRPVPGDLGDGANQSLYG